MLVGFHGSLVLALIHVVVLIIALGGILDLVGVGTGLDLSIVGGIGQSIFGRRNILSLVIVVEWDSLHISYISPIEDSKEDQDRVGYLPCTWI